jgi:hypothetical protein
MEKLAMVQKKGSKVDDNAEREHLHREIERPRKKNTEAKRILERIQVGRPDQEMQVDGTHNCPSIVVLSSSISDLV